MTGIVGNHGAFLAETPADRRDDGQQPDGLCDRAESRALLRGPGDRPGRRGDRGRGDPGQHRDGRGHPAGPPVPAAGLGGQAGFIPGEPRGRPAGCAAGGGSPQGPRRVHDRGDGHVVRRLHRPGLAPPGLPGARRRRPQRHPPDRAGPRRRSDPLRRICPRARGDAPRLVLPAVLSRDRAFLPGRDDGPGAGEPRRLVLDRAGPRPRPHPRDRPAGRSARVRVLGGAGVRPVAEHRGPIPVPQGALEARAGRDRDHHADATIRPPVETGR